MPVVGVLKVSSPNYIRASARSRCDMDSTGSAMPLIQFVIHILQLWYIIHHGQKISRNPIFIVHFGTP